MARRQPYIFVGSGSGIIPSGSPADVKAALARFKDLPIPIDGIDTAATYPSPNPGTSETILGQAGIGDTGLLLDTKVLAGPSAGEHPLSTEKIKLSINKSLERLKVSKVRVLYAHVPDESTPIAETVEGFGQVLKDGKAKEWGISNYSPQQVKDVLAECEKQKVPKPSQYQGMYNAISRCHEQELFPILRQHEIKYYAYSPTGGGFLNSNVATGEGLPSRFQGDHRAAQSWNEKYNKPEIIAALKELNVLCEKLSIPLLGAALRWAMYHSELGSEDAIILGASKVEQVDNSVEEIAKGPLPTEVIEDFEKLWQSVRNIAPR